MKNGEEFIKDSIQSVLNQSFRDFELLIIDDGSTDRTVSIIKSFIAEDSRIRLMYAEEHGFANVLNKGLREAASNYIARLDADDVMLPKRLEIQHRYLEANKSIDLVASHINYIDQNGIRKGVGGSAYHTPDQIRQEQKSELVIGFQHPSVMFLKVSVLELGGYRLGMWPVEDVDLWTRMVEAGMNLAVLEDVLTNYRVHPAAGSRSYDSIHKLDWVKACVLARREGRKEPSWENFKEKNYCKPFFERFSYKRKTYGKYLYRKASQAWLCGFRLRSFFSLGLAFILSPSHVRKRALKFKK